MLALPEVNKGKCRRVIKAFGVLASVSVMISDVVAQPPGSEYCVNAAHCQGSCTSEGRNITCPGVFGCVMVLTTCGWDGDFSCSEHV